MTVLSRALPCLRVLSLATVLLAVGCAEVPKDPIDRQAFDADNDPLEPMNRSIFAVNDSLDRHVIKPVAVAYRDNLPDGVQNSIQNLGNNLGEPLVFVNSVLQARFGWASDTLARFATNSVLGLGGLFDIAGAAHIQRHETDFGQTLYDWGVKGDGPYLVLPLFGPSNLRDAFGKGVDSVINPIGLVTRGSLTRQVLDGTGNRSVLDNGNATFEYVSMGITILSVIDLRARFLDEYDALQQGSLDFYAKLRSVTRQRRDAQLGKPRGAGGDGATAQIGPIVLDDPEAPKPAPSSQQNER